VLSKLNSQYAPLNLKLGSTLTVGVLLYSSLVINSYCLPAKKKTHTVLCFMFYFQLFYFSVHLPKSVYGNILWMQRLGLFLHFEIIFYQNQ
jgi:hypothetical protein